MTTDALDAGGPGWRRHRRTIVVAGLLVAAAVFAAVFWMTFHTRWDENRRLPLGGDQPGLSASPAKAP